MYNLILKTAFDLNIDLLICDNGLSTMINSKQVAITTLSQLLSIS